MELMFWQNFWFGLIVFMLFLYSLLDGYSLGVGIYFLFKKDKESAGGLFSMVTPFWIINIVWLLILLVSLFIVFPRFYGTILNSFYIQIMLVVLLYIMRSASLEFFKHDAARQSLWSYLTAVSSALIPFIALSILAALIFGFRVDESSIMVIRKNIPGILFILQAGIFGIFALLWYGLTFITSRQPSAESQNFAEILWLIYAGFSTIFLLYCIYLVKGLTSHPLVWTGAVFFLGGLIGSRMFLGNGRLSFILSGVSQFGIWFAAGAALFPAIISIRTGGGRGLSIYQASAPLSTLKPLAILMIFGILLILGYNYFIRAVISGAKKK